MRKYFEIFCLKLTFLLLFFISLSVYPLSGQERYTNSEIDLKIELSKKDINLTQEQVNDFRRELDNYKSEYQYNVQQQDDKIADRNNSISMFLTGLSILIALAGLFGYHKVKRDTQKAIQEELSGIIQVKGEVEKILEEAKKISKESLDSIQNTVQQANERARSIERLNEEGKKLVEGMGKQSFEKKSIDEKTKQELLEYLKKINKTKSDEELTANDWYLKGVNVSEEAELLTNKFQKEIKLREAIHYFQKAVELDPNNAATFNHWGYTLTFLGELKQSETLYKESIDLFAEALRLNKKIWESLNNWGWVLIELGKMTSNLNLFKESIKILQKSVKLEQNWTVQYHIARSYSLLNEKDDAFIWLENYLQNSDTRFDRTYIENDSDLNTIKDAPKFKKLLNKYLPKN
jgi:tetratricopeptide (TPR) repeat protein